MITDHIGDPCDLLSLRLAHPVLNLQPTNRFNKRYLMSLHRALSTNNVNHQKESTDLLEWAVVNGYHRFVKHRPPTVVGVEEEAAAFHRFVGWVELHCGEEIALDKAVVAIDYSPFKKVGGFLLVVHVVG